jgi:hypothetical protein
MEKIMTILDRQTAYAASRLAVGQANAAAPAQEKTIQ